MGLSKSSVEMLIDLVENKLSCMDVWDREDRCQAMILKRCLDELTVLCARSAIPAERLAFREVGKRPS